MLDPYRPALLCVASMLLAAAPARSATIATSPLYQVSPNTNQCLVANPGTSAVKVGRVEMVHSSGTIVAQSLDDLVIPPGTIFNLTISGGGTTYCRVLNASASKIRVTHCVRETGTGSPCISSSTGR